MSGMRCNKIRKTIYQLMGRVPQKCVFCQAGHCASRAFCMTYTDLKILKAVIAKYIGHCWNVWQISADTR